MADEILTPEQVRNIRENHMLHQACDYLSALADSHEALRAERDEWRERAMRRMEEAEQVEAECDRLAALVGEQRMCVNCGKTKPASEDRGTPLSECVGPDGMSACTFDMTPQEAWEHWRAEAHRLRELYSDLIYEVAKKHPGESRHQTAKRYIHERENSAVDQARAALAEAPTPAWDKERDQDELCRCGHPYYRHFDTYDNMAPVGCKYCECLSFEAPTPAREEGQ